MIMAVLPREGWRLVVAMLAAGAIAALGLAPFDWVWLGLFGFVAGLSMIAGAARPGQAAWLFGLGYFALALHWIVEPFFVDAAAHGWMAPFALVLMAGGMALFWVPAGLILRLRRVGNTEGTGAVALALALVLGEGARAYVFSGFPWAHPGHILVDTPLLGLAAWAGPHGLNLVVLVAAAAIASLLNRPWIALGAYLAAMAAVLVAPTADRPVLAEGATRVRLVQPNAPQDQKWLPEMIPVFYERGLELTRGGDVDLIVWPETSLPVLLEESALQREEIMAAAAGTPVVFGVQSYEGGRAFNALALQREDGLAAVYRKHHLVPFGEYMPIRRLAAWAGIDGLAAFARGGYWPGDSGPQTVHLGDGLGAAFLMICYEAIFPQYLRQVDRPDWQLHITNDAWFGSFSGPYQHLALARLRAAESGLPLLRAANTGISAVIDARGNVLDSLALNTSGVLDVALPPARPPTLYMRLGDLPVLGFAAVALCVLIAVRRKITR